MPAKKAKPPPVPSAAKAVVHPPDLPAALPPALAALTGTLATLSDATVVTTDGWQGGGVKILVANEKFAELTGYPAAGLTGQNTRLLHGPRTDLLAPGATPSDRAPRLVVGEGWLYRRDGTVFYGSWNFSPIIFQGRPSGCLVGIYRDVSENRRLREALLHSQQLATPALLPPRVA